MAQPSSSIHLDHTTTGILVPLYRHPTPTWDELIQVKHEHPSIPILVIVNPENGPGFGALNYVLGIKKLQSAGMPVLGYVYTRYGARNSSEIITEIDAYKNWYGVNGIFFDEMSHVPGHEDYYRNLNNYTKSIGLKLTIGNPGRDTAPSYISTVDSIVIYENSGLPAIDSLEGWHKNYSKYNFSILSYNVDELNKTFVRTVSHDVGFIYITDQTLPNPWYSLPIYFDHLVSLVGSSYHETDDSDLSEHFNTTCDEVYFLK